MHTYLAAVRKFEEFLAEKQLLLKEAPAGVMDDFVVWLSQRNLAPASIEITVRGARDYTKWCRAHGEECGDFAIGRLPKPELRIPEVLEEADLAKYFNYAIKLPDPVRTALMILPFCGPRVVELCKLPIDRVLVNYKDSSGKVWKVVFKMHGKGRKERIVPVIPPGDLFLEAYFRAWRVKQPKSKWLFPGKNFGRDNSLSAKTVQAYLRQMREALHLSDNLTPHMLRRTCFTMLYKKGVDVQTIAWIAGHASTETTMKYYIAVSPQDMLGKLTTSLERTA